MIDGTYGKEAAAAGYTAAAASASLHTGDPGTTGANEVTGGSPAYARQTVTWVDGTANDGIYTATLAFDIPAGTDVAFLALWDSSGNYLDKAEAVESFPAQGVCDVTLTFTGE